MVKMGAVWDRTAEFLTDNISAILPIALFGFFVPFTIQGNFGSVLEGASMELAATLGLIGLAFGVLATWAWLTLIAMTLESAGDPSRTATRRLVPALLVGIAMLVLVLLLFAPLVIAIRAGRSDPSTVELPMVLAWPLGLYLLAASAACIWGLARLILAYPLVVAERRLFGAFARSWQLTRGMSWPIVGVTLLFVLLALVAVLAAKSVFGSVFMLIAGPAGGLSLSGVLTSVTVAAVQTALTVVVPVFSTKLYLALVQREAAARA